jgi:hypothetical protein
VRQSIHANRFAVRPTALSHKQKIKPPNDNARKETTQYCRSQSAFRLILFVPLLCDFSDIHDLIFNDVEKNRIGLHVVMRTAATGILNAYISSGWLH